MNNLLRSTAERAARYLETAGDRSVAPELSRRARGVDVWPALRSLGRSGVAEAQPGGETARGGSVRTVSMQMLSFLG